VLVTVAGVRGFSVTPKALVAGVSWLLLGRLLPTVASLEEDVGQIRANIFVKLGKVPTGEVKAAHPWSPCRCHDWRPGPVLVAQTMSL
jgi:hypothetical protein